MKKNIKIYWLSSCILSLICCAYAYADNTNDIIIKILSSRLTTAEFAKVEKSQSWREARWLDLKTPQALSQGLIETKLLETLNHFALAPRDLQGGLDGSAFTRIFIGRNQQRQYTLAFKQSSQIYCTLIVFPVAPDSATDSITSFSPQRLHRLAEALRELEQFRLVALEKDAYGNVFAWSGTAAAATVRVWYLPADNELRLLWISAT